MKTLTVVGALSLIDGDKVNADTRRQMNEILAASGIGGIVAREAWESGDIKINKSILASSPHAPVAFIHKLKEVVANPKFVALGLKGDISVALIGSEPIVFSVRIHGARLAYQRASITWKAEAVSNVA